MAKIISYQIKSGEELLPVKIPCETRVIFDANYPIAEKEAVGEIIVVGEFDPVPAPPTEDSAVWDELDAAYQEGVDSV